MPVNEQLKSRVWMHTLTHVLYAVDFDCVGTEGVVKYSTDDGRNWIPSKEFPSVTALTDAIANRSLVMQFTPQKDDFEGVKAIFNQCQRLTAECNKTDHKDKRTVGRISALKLVMQMCSDYMSKARLPQEAPPPAEASTCEEAEQPADAD